MAITLSTIADGIFPEVAYSPVGDLWIVYQASSGELVVTKNGPTVHVVGLSVGQQAYPKMSGDGMIVRGPSDLPYYWADANQPFATAQILDGVIATGTDPVVIGHGWIAWQRGTAPFPIMRRLASGGSAVSVGAARPTGLSRITSSGAIVLVDTDRAQLNPGGGVWGTRPSFAGSAIAAEGPSGGVVVRNGNDLLLWAGLTSYTPRIAQHPVSGDFAVVTWGAPHGIRLALITASEFTGGSPPPDPGGGGGGGRPTPEPPRLGRTGPSPITPRLSTRRPSRPVYPHVTRVVDKDAQQALRILFERSHSTEQRLDEVGGVDERITALSAQVSSLQQQLVAQENALRGAEAAAGVKVGVGGSLDPIAVPDGGAPGGGETGSGPTPGGPGGSAGSGPTLPLPNYLNVVADYANANPAELTNSCQNAGGTWDFMDGVVDALRAIDSRFGYNCKRGNCNDPSHDAIAYYWGEGAPFEGARKVYVIDIIGGHCGPNPTPTWTNQTSPSGNTNGAGWTSRGRF